MENRIMPHAALVSVSSRNPFVTVTLLSSLILVLCVAGCGGGNGKSGSTPAPPTSGAQTYFSPYVAGSTISGGADFPGPKIYALDDSANTFTESTFALLPPDQEGSQVFNTGGITPSQRGLLNLGITTSYAANSSGVYLPTTSSPPKSGSFAVELAGQAGGLLQIVGQPVSPLAATTQCLSQTAAQTYQFLTIPAGLIDSSAFGQQRNSWDPKTDTAYGSVDISSNRSNVNFNNIHQFLLPSVKGPGVQPQQSVSSSTGVCGSTVYGNTITVGQSIIADPGGPQGGSTPPQAYVAVGPSGLLVEHNGSGDGLGNGTFPGTSLALLYDNTLGAGTGAVGLPKPSSALDANSLRSGQYLGFVYGAGTYSSLDVPTGWSSHLTSFGFSGSPALPSSCSSFASQTGPLVNGIYGGDFPQSNGQDNPSASPDGFGNCDLAIDLGTQDSANNGLFPKATVWLGGNYIANPTEATTKTTYSFSAVAIAGQLNGKNAIFVLGVDATQPQPWAIYLLQSN